MLLVGKSTWDRLLYVVDPGYGITHLVEAGITVHHLLNFEHAMWLHMTYVDIQVFYRISAFNHKCPILWHTRSSYLKTLYLSWRQYYIKLLPVITIGKCYNQKNIFLITHKSFLSYALPPTHWALQFWVRGSNTTKFTE